VTCDIGAQKGQNLHLSTPRPGFHHLKFGFLEVSLPFSLEWVSTINPDYCSRNDGPLKGEKILNFRDYGVEGLSEINACES
jgi:hypothetical protein